MIQKIFYLVLSFLIGATALASQQPAAAAGSGAQTSAGAAKTVLAHEALGSSLPCSRFVEKFIDPLGDLMKKAAQLKDCGSRMKCIGNLLRCY